MSTHKEMNIQKISISLIVPAFNEEECLEETVGMFIDDLSAVCERYEIIIIDDGSTDRTGEIADRLAQGHDGIRVLHHGRNMGIGYTVKEGFKKARCDLVLLNCADRPFDTKSLRKITPMFDDADVVVVVRKDRSANSLYRKITSTVNYYLIRLLFRLKLSDFQFVQIYRKEVIDKIKIESCSAFIPPEMLIKASHLGFRLKEFKAEFHPRPAGKAKCGHPMVILRAVDDIFRFWWRWKIVRKKKDYSLKRSVRVVEGMAPSNQ